jgi:nucleoside-diphosphate-sugar epimerase
MTRVLVAGGAGFVGYHLIARLLRAPNAELTVLDNLSRTGCDTHLARLIDDPRVTFIRADLTDPTQYDRADGTFDHVYHLAAVNGTGSFYEIPHEVLRVNILSLFHVLDWIKRTNPAATLMFTSSNEAYASNLEAFGTLPLPTPENVPLSIADTYNPRWSYGGSKLIGELIVINTARAFGLKAVIVRPHNFYGPRAGYGHVIPQFIERIAARTDPFAIYGGDETRSFAYIEDVVDHMARIMELPHVPGETLTLHLGSEEEISVSYLADLLFEVAGWHPSTIDLHPPPRGSVRRRCPDTTRVKRLLGYERLTPLHEGLSRTFAWYRDNPRPQPQP